VGRGGRDDQFPGKGPCCPGPISSLLPDLIGVWNRSKAPALLDTGAGTRGRLVLAQRRYEAAAPAVIPRSPGPQKMESWSATSCGSLKARPTAQARPLKPAVLQPGRLAMRRGDRLRQPCWPPPRASPRRGEGFPTPAGGGPAGGLDALARRVDALPDLMRLPRQGWLVIVIGGPIAVIRMCRHGQSGGVTVIAAAHAEVLIWRPMGLTAPAKPALDGGAMTGLPGCNALLGDPPLLAMPLEKLLSSATAFRQRARHPAQPPYALPAALATGTLASGGPNTTTLG